MATFRRVSAGKSVSKLVGANLKDGQNVLVGGWSQASSSDHLVGERRIRVGRGLVAGIVEGGVGGAGARAADGCWLRRAFRSSVRVLARARRRWGAAPSGRFHLIGVVLEHGGVGGCWLYWEGST